MSAKRHPEGKRAKQDLLSEILDFGEDTSQETTPAFSEKIRKVKAQIDELQERITRLTQRTR